MNYIRIIGLLLLMVAIILFYTFNNSGVTFLISLFGCSGIILLITGKFSVKKN